MLSKKALLAQMQERPTLKAGMSVVQVHHREHTWVLDVNQGSKKSA